MSSTSPVYKQYMSYSWSTQVSYNGNGVFLINTAGQPVVANTVISATTFNLLTADLANGLTNAITKDGQTTVTANIPMSNFKITGLGAATAANDAVRLEQLTNGATNVSFGNLAYTGTLTGGTGVVNIGSGQVYKDASGNLLIGGTSSLYGASGRGNIEINGSSSSILALTTAGSATNSSYLFNSSTDLELAATGSRFMRFTVNGSERMRIDSSGNLLVGTTTSTSKLTIASTGAAQSIITGTDAGNGYIQFIGAAAARLGYIGYGDSSSHMYMFNDKNAALIFGNNSTERMRIDSSGNLMVGTTSTTGERIQVLGSSGSGTMSVQVGANGNNGIGFRNASGSSVGSITVSVSSVAYNTSSDYRLKDNVAPMTGALEKVAALKPVTYTWKTDGSDGQGFIAHELQAVVPDCVTGIKDALDAEGKPRYQGVDTSFLVATLTAALQEAHGLIKDLQVRVDLLEAK